MTETLQDYIDRHTYNADKKDLDHTLAQIAETNARMDRDYTANMARFEKEYDRRTAESEKMLAMREREVNTLIQKQESEIKAFREHQKLEIQALREHLAGELRLLTETQQARLDRQDDKLKFMDWKLNTLIIGVFLPWIIHWSQHLFNQ